MLSSNPTRNTVQAATSTVPAFTPVDGGFITVQTLDNGRLLVESWRLNPDPADYPQPCTQPVHHCITTDTDDALTLITQFTDDITRINSRKNA